MSQRFDPAKTMRIDLRREEKGDARGDTVGARALGATSYRVQMREEHGEATTTEYERLLQSIYDAVLITDSGGHVVDFNNRSLEFFCYSAEELATATVMRLVAGVDENVMANIRRNLMQRRFTLIEGNCVRRDGSTFASEVAVNRLDFDPEGRLCFFVRDISVRKRAQAALEDAVARLEAHDRARSLFVSNVSHELRTPLTSMIYAITNMLRGVVGDVPKRVRDYLEMLEGDCKRLLATVNDILDMRKIESNQLVLNRTTLPLARIVKRATGPLRVQASQKSVDLLVDLGEEAWFANVDPEKLERVIINIVGNAIKFTPEGGRVTVRIEEDRVRYGRVLISVLDTGIGIPSDALPRVTERYFTVGAQPSGTGLGLAITREIVELHGGRLDVASPPMGCAKGTFVGVSLDKVKPQTVLLAIHDEDVRAAALREMLGPGYQVLEVSSAEEVRAVLDRQVPDAFIVALELPDVVGTELILRLCTGVVTGPLPLVVISNGPLDRAKATVLMNLQVPHVQSGWSEGDLLNALERAYLRRRHALPTDRD